MKWFSFRRDNLISIYERNLEPYPVNLNMIAYTDTMRATLGGVFSVMIEHYSDGYGRFYVYAEEWEEIGKQVLQRLLDGTIKPSVLFNRLRRQNATMLRLLSRPPKPLTGTFFRQVNKGILKLIALGDPVSFVIEPIAAKRLSDTLDTETVALLTKIDHKSFLMREKCRLATIATQGNEAVLKRHARAFAHLIFDYTGPVSSYENFKRRYNELRTDREKLQETLKECRIYDRNVHAAKELAYRTQAISPELKKLAQLLSETAFIFDTRKGFMTRLTYLLSTALDQLAKERGINRKSLNWLTPDEVVAVADGMLDIKSLNIELRKKEGIFVSDNDKLTHANTTEREHWLPQIWDAQQPKTETIKGTVGSKGVAKGRARVILYHRDIAKIKQGEILVTSYTAVNFLPAMRKAAAIVTDFGGITSHAAVVSRELGIPAVVDTKVATKILNTGDKIEVDAEKGIVRKL